MKKEEIKYFCDICGENTKEKDIFQVNYPVIFTTNQTDGKECKAYIEQEQIDICRNCADKVLKISASGCQGYNEYKVINEGSKWQKLERWLTDKHNNDNDNSLLYTEILIKMRELEGEDE